MQEFSVPYHLPDESSTPITIEDGPLGMTIIRLAIARQLFVGVAMTHISYDRDMNRWDIDKLAGVTGDFYAQTTGQRVFIAEGSVPSLPTDAKPFKLLETHVAGEMALEAAVAKGKHNTRVIAGEAPDYTRAKNLITQNCSPQKAALLPVMREVTAWDPKNGLTFHAHITQRVSQRYQAVWNGWQGLPYIDLSYDGIAALYFQEFKRHFGPNEAEFCFEQVIKPVLEHIPENERTPMQAVTVLDTAHRNQYLPALCLKLWVEGCNQLVVRGKPHRQTLLAAARGIYNYAITKKTAPEI
ncbi:MAG TPA: hypothetical protein VFB59_03130 [Candidatus Saccharimonadales bacterium]|nr:hypothetical protein [Candidatus Saccharimonadales bacterium]